ncbi:MAG: peptidoglycan-binding protein [Candidatus Eisenbacteria sp.]|nr:peptidoglycan-binding protein [Candidatus Eisenbacteria bacterium]
MHIERHGGLVASAIALALCTLLLGAAGAGADDTARIKAAEAAQHVGEVAEVCGRVASAAHIAAVKGQPTFLNFERPYPDQPFNVVIWGSARSRFDAPPERAFDGKEICVTGLIETYRGKPQIVVSDPEQIVLVNPPEGGSELTETERILVKALLASLGHETNYGSGEWDEQTVEAMIAFQEAEGITPTGEPGSATLRALADAVPGISDGDRDLVIRLLLFELARRGE